MSFPSMTLLLCLWFSSAIAYKLLLLDKALLTDDEHTINKPNNSPSGNNYKWEWQSQDRLDEGNVLLARLRREIIDKKYKKEDVKPDGKFLPKLKPTEPPLDELYDSTPYILEQSSAALKKVPIMPLLIEEEATTLEQKTNEAEQKLDEDETTHVGKSITQSSTLVTELTLSPTTSEELSVLTSNKYNKATEVNHAHSTHSTDASSQQTSTNDNLLEEVTSSFSPKAPGTTPTLMPVTPQEQTTEHDVTTVSFSASSGSSTKLAAVTHIAISLEDKVNTQSIMRQCMITILILAVVCTIFIISTIALAAKLSTMKQKSKLRHPVTYTEMRCISSLLPDNDQQNKPKTKRLKTFASSLEESDGDNTTLNSFLPDH